MFNLKSLPPWLWYFVFYSPWLWYRYDICSNMVVSPAMVVMKTWLWYIWWCICNIHGCVIQEWGEAEKCKVTLFTLSPAHNWELKYIWLFGQIHFANRTNTFCKLDKYILQIGQILFAHTSHQPTIGSLNQIMSRFVSAFSWGNPSITKDWSGLFRILKTIEKLSKSPWIFCQLAWTSKWKHIPQNQDVLRLRC